MKISFNTQRFINLQVCDENPQIPSAITNVNHVFFEFY